MKPHSSLLELSGEGGTCQRAAHTHEYAFTHEAHTHIVERWEIIYSLYILHVFMCLHFFILWQQNPYYTLCQIYVSFTVYFTFSEG